MNSACMEYVYCPEEGFWFIDLITREADVASIDSVNNLELCEENPETKVKVRLSNRLPKTQVVKGEFMWGISIWLWWY